MALAGEIKHTLTITHPITAIDRAGAYREVKDYFLEKERNGGERDLVSVEAFHDTLTGNKAYITTDVRGVMDLILTTEGMDSDIWPVIERNNYGNESLRFERVTGMFVNPPYGKDGFKNGNARG